MSDQIHELDARDLQCPLPLLKAKQALNSLQKGEKLRVLASDKGSVRDFKTYTDLSAHILLESEECDGVFSYLIEKQ